MTLDMPFPMQKSDIEFAYHRFYEMMRLVGGPSGVLSLADFQVTQKAAGANMSAPILCGLRSPGVERGEPAPPAIRLCQDRQ